MERERYVTDLELVAVERPSGSAPWLAVQDRCAERFSELRCHFATQVISSTGGAVADLLGVE